MECLINGVSFEGCNSNKNVIFVDSYKEVFFDILSLELNEQTIIAELIENTKTGPYVNIKKVILNGKAYQDIKFLVIKEKADTRIHLNETKLNESAAGIDYIQPKLTPAIRVNTPVVAPNSKPVDVSARQEIERIKEQALSNIRVEKEKLLLLKEEINSANISIDGKVEEYRSELLKSFYDIADSNKNILEKKIDIALKDATSQLQEINSTNYINHVNDIVKKHVDDIAAQYSGKEKDLLESINDKVTVDISEIANVLEGKVNLAIKTIAEDNTVTIQDKNNQILEHVNKEITNATESLNITLENYKTHLLDNYLQTLKNSSDEFKKSTNVTLNEAVTDLQEKNQTAFNLQSNNSITKSVNDLTKIIESSKLEFGQEMRTSLREVTDDVSTKILNSFNLEKIKIDEKIEHLNAEAVDIFNNLKHNTKVSLESKIEAIDSNINSLNDTKNKFIDEVTILIEQFKTKTLQSIEAEKLIIDEKIKKLDTISKNTEDTISKLSEQVTANKEKLVDEVDTYLHEVAIANKNTVAEKIEELQKKINESLLEVNIETVYSKFIDVYGNKVDVAITEFIDSKKRLIKEELNDIGVPQPTQDFDTLIKSHWEQKEPEMMQKVKKIAATYADSYGGGGSVAVQYAKGGTMDGNLNITGMILSGGQDLSSIFSSGSGGGGGGGGNPAVNTLVTTTSADWNQSYTYFTWLTANSGSTSTVDLSNIAAVSANWNASYTNLVGNSGAYLSGVNLSDISSVSSNWNTSYTFLTSNSALILGDITNIASVSANWDNAWTNLIYNSGAYLSAVDLSNIAAVSANWNTSYTFLTSNSALILGDLSNIASVSANWDNAWTNLIYNSGAYLSAVDLSNIASVSSNWNTSYTFLTSNSALILGDLTNISNTSATWNNAWTNLIYNSGAYLSAVDLSNIAAVSANWNNTYTQFNSNSALYATTSYVNSNFLSLSGGTLSGTLTLYKDLSVLGNLFVTGSATFSNTIITSTSALSVVNTGPGPALYISQGPGGGDIASFYDSTNNLEVLHIGNDTPWINNKGIIGIRTSNPNETLTVIGGISATGIISTSATNSNSNNWTSSFTYANANSAKLTSSTSNYLPLSGGTLTGGLTGTTGTFSGALAVTGVTTLGNGAILGTPASGVVTNLTGTASININGTVGATTANTLTATTITTTGNITNNTADPYLILNRTATTNYNGIKLLTGNATTGGWEIYGSNAASQNLNIYSYAAASAIGVFSSTGLSVTGALSASSTANIGGGKAYGTGATIKPATDDYGLTLLQSNDNAVGWGLKAGTSGSLLFTRYNASAFGTPAISVTGDGAVSMANGLAVTGALSATTGGIFATSSGSVGIGTSSPSYKLEVKGDASWFRNFAGAPASPSEVQDWPIPAVNIASYGDFTLQTMLAFTLPNDGNYFTDYSVWNFKLAQGASSTTSMGVSGMEFGGRGYLAFLPGNSEKVRITSAGNVGIGTASPATALHISKTTDGGIRTTVGSDATRSTVNYSDGIYGNRLNASSNYVINTSTGSLYLQNDYSGNVYMVTGGGNVGIGTASPATKLHVYEATNYPQIRISGTGAGADTGPNLGFYCGDSAGNPWEAGYITVRNTSANQSSASASSYMDFYTSSSGTVSNRMRISATGNVGIGTTSPTYGLDVFKYFASGGWNYNLRLTDNINATFLVGHQSGSTILQSDQAIKIAPSNTIIGVFSSTGLAITGALSTTGAGTFPGFSANKTTANSGRIWIQDVGANSYNEIQSRNYANTADLSLNITSSIGVYINGPLSKASGSFRIEHPLPSKSDTHQLVHSFVEAPKCDLIYRGKVDLVNGKASVNIDTVATMTEGTFEVLCGDVQCFTSNESGWGAIRGKVLGNILTIEAQDATSTDNVSWMVIGERKDKHIMDTGWTDDNGRPIVEPLKPA